MIFQIAAGIVVAYLIIAIGMPVVRWLFRFTISVLFDKSVVPSETTKPFCFHSKVGATVQTADGYFEAPCLNCGLILRQPILQRENNVVDVTKKGDSDFHQKNGDTPPVRISDES